MEKQSFNPQILNIALSILVAFVVIWVLIIGRDIILPFTIAVFLTFILDPLVTLLQKIKIPRAIGVLLTMVISFIFLYLLGLLVYTNVQTFVSQWPSYEEKLVGLLESLVSHFEELIGQETTVDLWKNIDWLGTFKDFSIASSLVSGVGNFFTFFGKMLLVMVFMAFMLMGKVNLQYKIAKAFRSDEAKRIDEIINEATQKIQKYIGTKLIVSFVTAVISLIIFYAFGLDFVFFWAIVIFVLNFIPNIGSIIASILPVLFSILQFGSIGTAFWLLIAIGVLQFVMGNILEPRLMGYSLDLSPMIVILSLIFWGYIWGVAGMLISVPMLATITIVFERFDSLRFISVFLRGKV